MTKPLKMLVMICTLVIVVALAGSAAYGLFHGYFDRGVYEVKEVQRFSSSELAVVAKTSDGQALDGDVYFVLIGDHVFSAQELKKNYYAHKAVFATSRDCLTLKWRNSSTLEVSCTGIPITTGQIDYQQSQAGTTTIAYLNIAATK